MPERRGVSRREVLRIGAATFASTALYDLLSGPANALASTGAGARPGIHYFSRFGATEELIR